LKGITVAHLVFISLAVAGLFVAIRWLVPWETTRVDLLKRMGSPGWDFTSSWASNFTVVGAVLGTILGAGVLPDQTHLFPKGSYSALNLLFGVVTVLAPIAYLASQARDPAANELRGYVWSFLVTTVITLWAVLGELATIAFLLYEIRSAGSLPTSVTYFFAGVMLAAAILMLIYVWRGIPDTIRSQAKVRSAGAPLPRWSIF
jgi:hypothetical protein